MHGAGRLIGTSFVALLVAAAAAAPSPLIDAERMLVVDGAPRLILGLYEHPAEDERLRQAVEAGFNLIQCPPDAAALDRVGALGAKAWVNLGAALDLGCEAESRHAALVATVERLKDHPALLVWEGPDEAVWNQYWVPYSAVTNRVLPAMRAVAAQPGDAAAELAALVERAEDSLSRGLPDRFEAQRADFWRLAGGADPEPAARLDDALDRGRRTADGLAAGIDVVRAADPRHVVWLNHAPCNSLALLTRASRAADMVGCDIYPIPANQDVGHSDIGNVWPDCVGGYTDRMRRAAPGKSCAMVLQGFGWRDLAVLEGREPDPDPRRGRRPFFGESRFMAYNALLHGANALVYWGTNFSRHEGSGPATAGESPPADDSRLWRDLLRLARELRALEPAWLAPAVRPEPRLVIEEGFGSNDGTGIRLTLRQVGEDHVLVVANETGAGQALAGGLAFTVHDLPASLEGRTLHRLGSGESHVVRDRGFRDGIRRFDVHVYATSRRFEARE